jgi:phage shock protein PspC (stress-responsive transcriptional regulator)
MSKNTQDLVLTNLTPADALRLCCDATATLGLKIAEPNSTPLIVKQSLNLLSTGSPVTLTITFTSSSDGTVIHLEGANFGWGPLQNKHVKESVDTFRNQLESMIAEAGTQSGSTQSGESTADGLAQTTTASLLSCNVCGGKVASTAKACPHCGAPNSDVHLHKESKPPQSVEINRLKDPPIPTREPASQPVFDSRYQQSSFYCSSDDKEFLGVCGGIGHKLDVNRSLLRITLVIISFFTLFIPGIIYLLIGLGAPKLPTKGVPSPGRNHPKGH